MNSAMHYLLTKFIDNMKGEFITVSTNYSSKIHRTSFTRRSMCVVERLARKIFKAMEEEIREVLGTIDQKI